MRVEKIRVKCWILTIQNWVKSNKGIVGLAKCDSNTVTFQLTFYASHASLHNAVIAILASLTYLGCLQVIEKLWSFIENREFRGIHREFGHFARIWYFKTSRWVLQTYFINHTSLPENVLNFGSILFRPQCFLRPQLQVMSCYIARYYVKIMHVRLGVVKHIFPLSCGRGGGGGQNIIDPEFFITWNAHCIMNQLNQLGLRLVASVRKIRAFNRATYELHHLPQGQYWALRPSPAGVALWTKRNCHTWRWYNRKH